MQLKTVFFGSGTYSIPIIESLADFNVQLIVTTEADPTASRKEENQFVSYLKSKSLPFISSRLKNHDDIEKIKSLQPTIGVLASYGAILPSEILELFPLGIINVHPSLLPLYKGPTPVQTTILNGDTKTGTTIIQLDDKVDHGPIISQEEVALSGRETTEDLKAQLFKLGADMIHDILEELQEKEKIIARPQDHTKEVFTKKVTRESGHIDLTAPPSKEVLDRMIRAYYPWPGVWTQAKIKGQELRIKLLPNEMLQVEGKRAMSYKDFMNGYGEKGRELLKNII